MRQIAALLLLSSVAHADAWDRVAEGAAFYGEVRPVALSGTLKRLGIDQLPAVVELKKKVGGIDIFDPALLAPTGLDAASPVVVAVELLAPAGLTHVRVAATLRDIAMFKIFAAALASGGQVPLQSVDAATPAGKAGVLFVADLPDHMTAIARLAGEIVVADFVDTWDDKPMAAAEVARRFPVDVKPFVPGRGARRLFAADTALGFYADGRRFGEVLDAIGRIDLEDELKKAKKAQRASLKQKKLAALKRCVADWNRSPSTFDDAAFALAADPKEVRWTMGWGTVGEPALGGLRFSPVDDAAVDSDFLARQAPLVGALYAASGAPFTALKHGGIYQSLDTLSQFDKRCGDQVAVGIALRGWPLAIAAGLSEMGNPQQAASTGLDLSAALSVFGQLRNVVFMVRDANAGMPSFAVAATFDGAARTFIETVLAAIGATGSPKAIGKRNPTVYSISNPSIGNFVAGLETLQSGPLMFTFADSEESLLAAYRKPTLMPGAKPPARGPTPIAALHLDAAFVGRAAGAINQTENARPAIEMMSRLKRFDADLTADGDLFRLTVRAPLK